MAIIADESAALFIPLVYTSAVSVDASSSKKKYKTRKSKKKTILKGSMANRNEGPPGGAPCLKIGATKRSGLTEAAVAANFLLLKWNEHSLFGSGLFALGLLCVFC